MLPDLHVKSGDNGWPFLKLLPIFNWLSLDLCTLKNYEITVIHWQNMYSSPYGTPKLESLTLKPIYLGVSINVRDLSDYVFIFWRKESQEVIIIEDWVARDLIQTYLRLPLQ